MCSNNTKKYTREEVKQQMLDYIEDKYNMEFEVADIWYQTWGRDWEEMRAYPKGGDPEDTFDIYRYTKDNGDVYFVDQYLVFAKKDEYKEFIDGLIDDYFPEYRSEIYFKCPLKEESSLTTEISFSEFKEYINDKVSVNIQVYVPAVNEDEMKQTADALYKIVKANVAEGNLFVFGYTEKNYKTEVKDQESSFNTDYAFCEVKEYWKR